MAIKYPYSQIIQLMYGLRLRTSSEHLFNQQLGKTAVLTNDRSVLFELFENKPRTLNAGIETVEVDQLVEAPSIAPIESSSPSPSPVIQTSEEVLAPASEKTTSPEPKPEMEQPATQEEKEETPKSPVIPAAQVTPASPPPAKPALPSATPENMEGLSPQDRVKAILERNRQLREQFEAQKNKGDEMLFSQPSLIPPSDATEVDNGEAKEEIEAATSAESSSKEDALENIKSGTEATESVEAIEELSPSPESSGVESSMDVEAPAESEEEALKVENQDLDSSSVDEPETTQASAFETPSETPSKAKSEAENEPSSEPEPWADTPIDIEALIRRRFARRFEIQEEEIENDPWAEEAEEESLTDTYSEEEQVDSPAEGDVLSEEENETTQEESQAVEAEADSLETEADLAPQEETEASDATATKESEEPQTDLALAARIRVIRDRLDRLKESDALSKEELQALMDEHQQLEALMSDLPLDEDHLFEVEDADDLSSVSNSPDPVEVQGEVNISEPELEDEDYAGESEIAETSAEAVEVEVAEETESQEEEAEEDLQENTILETEEAEDSEENLASEVSEKREEAPDALETAPIISLTVESTEAKAETSEAEASEAEASKADEKPAAQADEEDLEDIDSDPDEPVSEEDAVDAEIRRIEALAARLRTGSNREMSQDEINALRERRMEDMIAQRKKSLEDSRSVAKETEQSSLSADVAKDELKEESPAEEAPVQEVPAAKSEQEAPKVAAVEPNQGEEISAEKRETAEVESLSASTEVEDLSAPESKAESEAESETESETESEAEAETESEQSKAPTAEELGSNESNESNEPKESEAPVEVSSESTEVSGPSFSEWLKNLRGGASGSTSPAETSESEDSSEVEASEVEASEAEASEAEGSDAASSAAAEAIQTSPSAEAIEDKSAEQTAPEAEESRAEIAEKIELLDSFVEKLPELKMQSRAGKEPAKPTEAKRTSIENADSEGGGGLVTETLAKVYIRQKHYKKAIQAYEILMLKYPEKSSFFASQISEIKKLDNSK